MPIYVIRCPECGETDEVFRSISQMDDLPKHCGKPMRRVICPPMVVADIQPYRSMVTGEMITSRSHHARHLRQHGVVEVGNEPMTQKKTPWIEQKKQKDELRREIAARLDSIPN